MPQSVELKGMKPFVVGSLCTLWMLSVTGCFRASFAPSDPADPGSSTAVEEPVVVSDVASDGASGVVDEADDPDETVEPENAADVGFARTIDLQAHVDARIKAENKVGVTRVDLEHSAALEIPSGLRVHAPGVERAQIYIKFFSERNYWVRCLYEYENREVHWKNCTGRGGHTIAKKPGMSLQPVRRVVLRIKARRPQEALDTGVRIRVLEWFQDRPVPESTTKKLRSPRTKKTKKKDR